MILDDFYSYFNYFCDVYLEFLPCFFVLGFIFTLYFFITDFKDCVPLQGFFSYIFMHIFIFILFSLLFPFAFVFWSCDFIIDCYDSLNERSKTWFNFEKF